MLDDTALFSLLYRVAPERLSGKKTAKLYKSGVGNEHEGWVGVYVPSFVVWNVTADLPVLSVEVVIWLYISLFLVSGIYEPTEKFTFRKLEHCPCFHLPRYDGIIWCWDFKIRFLLFLLLDLGNVNKWVCRLALDRATFVLVVKWSSGHVVRRVSHTCLTLISAVVIRLSQQTDH